MKQTAFFISCKKNSAAPGEDRTHNLRISLLHAQRTAYKYGALTDCATGAPKPPSPK